jgi:ethanolamine permease
MAERVESSTGAGTQSDYLAARQLKAGSASWVLLAGLGVAYVIGDYAGWHFGLAQGGWGGLAIAAVLMGVMYACMVLGLAEMSSALPAAGGGYTFARVAMGPWGGFATGAAILLEYAVAPAAIATFIGGYVESLGLFGITDGWWVYLTCYVVFVGIHLLGVGEALKATFVIAAVALVGLILFAVGGIMSFDAANLTDIPVTEAAGASPLLPFGVVGVWASFPFAIWFFLAVEGVPLAAEEARDPVRAVPRGIIVAMGVLVLSATAVLLLAPGAQGAQALSESDNPLVSALEAGLGAGWLSTTVNYIGLLGLIASFFSIIYAYSRQTFALSRAGYLPRVLSRTNARKAPTLALVIPALIGFVLAATGNGDILINLAVFGATLSYVLMMVSHQLLRARRPDLPRPYRTPGGRVTTGVALVLAVAAVVATFLVDVVAALCALGAFALLMAYFGFYSRHHLVAAAPDEEFAALAQAEEELE